MNGKHSLLICLAYVMTAREVSLHSSEKGSAKIQVDDTKVIENNSLQSL